MITKIDKSYFIEPKSDTGKGTGIIGMTNSSFTQNANMISEDLETAWRNRDYMRKLVDEYRYDRDDSTESIRNIIEAIKRQSWD